MFGYCLLRIIHFIVALRLKYPNTPIVIQKVDWKSAYRRAHLNWETSLQCCSVFKQFVLIPLRAVFGGSPCPSEWSIFSESACDLANMFLSHDDWEPLDRHSPIQTRIPPPKLLSEKIPFGEAKPLIVSVPTDNVGKTDVYIDDLVTVALGSDNFIHKAESAVPLAIHTMGRPLMRNEPILLVKTSSVSRNSRLKADSKKRRPF